MAEIRAHGDKTRSAKIRVDGPHVSIPVTAAQPLSLAIHELATNALKYGALSQPDAQLEVAWRVERRPPLEEVVLEWRERGVPMPRSRPTRRGYGSELIERALPYQLNATTKLEFTAEGVECMVRIPINPNDAPLDA